MKNERRRLVRLLPAAALLALLPQSQPSGSAVGAPTERGVDRPSGVTVLIVEPRHPWWMGRIAFVLEVGSAPGDPIERVDFVLDGSPLATVTRLPFRLVHDFGETLKAHRLEVVARARSGAVGSTSALSAAPGIQQRAEVELVLVPVSVLGPDGLTIRGLAREDFALYENGEAQPIVTFDPEPPPVSLVFGLDCSGSMDRIFPLVKAAAIRFVQRLPSFFSVGLLTFGDSIEMSCDFTLDRDHLFYELNRRRADGSVTPLLGASLSAIEALRSRPGRRAAALFTDGEETAEEPDGQEPLAQKVVARARSAGVEVFFVSYGRSRRADLLERIATETGGEFLPAGSERRITAAFERIARDLGAQYTLGLRPPRDGPAGEWRSLRVEVRGKPATTVTARAGYISRE